MKKQYIIYKIFSLLSIFYFSITEGAIRIQSGVVPSLQVLNTKSLFDFQGNGQQRVFNQQLKQGKILIEALKFDGLIIEDLDSSNMCLKGIKFNGCTFKKVKLQNADLRDTEFKKCHFQDVDLTDAILYYSKKTASEKELFNNGFKVSNWDPYPLVRLYSDLMKRSRTVKGKGSDNFFEKAKCLNKFIPALRLNLYDKNLKGFDLRNIDLENANLESTSLQGVRLSENVFVPNYSGDNKTILFKLWVNGNNEQQKVYQKLVHARFNITIGVDPEALREGIQTKKDLRKANLQHTQLQGIDLKDVNLEGAYLQNSNLQGTNLAKSNLKNAYLRHTQLEGANLIEANLQNAHLVYAHLQKVKVSKNVVVPDYPENDRTLLFNLWLNGNEEEQKIYQNLFNTGFDMTQGVKHSTLCKGLFVKKDLRHAYLYELDLRNAILKGVNLESANLMGAQLQKANLMNTNLKNARLHDAQLQEAILTGANLEKAYLRDVQLKGANLVNANLQGAHITNTTLQQTNLTGANLQGAILLDAQFEGAKLIKANLAGAMLSRNYSLPLNCKDKDLMNIYKTCKDKKAKNMLKDILKAKNICIK